MAIDLKQDSDSTQQDLTAVEWAGIAAALIWLVGAGVYFTFFSTGSGENSDGIRFVFTLVALLLPVAVVWMAVTSARNMRIYREETDRLRQSIDSMRAALLAERQAKTQAIAPQVEEKLAAIAHTAQKTETVLATFTSSRQAGRVQVPLPRSVEADEQPSLALGTPAEDLEPPLSTTDLIRALNFPETQEDVEGFAALRAALKDRQARQLVQAAQDILTLLSQDGIYMDDMRPDRARPDIWRRFAKGERGRTVAALGGIRDRSCLALTSTRMREDAIFRDAAHHFLRRFDKTLIEFEEHATDEEIVSLSETRTSRAFMLLGRVSGAFN
ncbi:hypothetical protein BVC71_00670 [Marivivens niveibacter]|uniref:Uncharacterized protein n=1 Tax=Marivivens niveibacter TaxID=1930667 RepID=A0A251X174_9RHOB|nr:hypothetical protein [Marivivens niveibacter]OUD10064.1 hypothetical protein BVC71_00670 [Marivivens niveibacter]